MLKKIYTESGLFLKAVEQVHRALFGFDGFKNGVPYDLGSDDPESTGDPDGYTRFIPVGEPCPSDILRELRAMTNNPGGAGSFT